ncbi:PREDICTED: putative FBD-associated F-box protein At5g56430 [Camelina sativa]|uniref:FBD-associated F-box protein At5g56430 n=1 Tax=Camelina sativa TaxID=90675 RepID=A0ABM0WV71_CAMSA|nr:PREDICTED: putative FBD-associated F-box protein At5g56430 [Camelina sativa]
MICLTILLVKILSSIPTKVAVSTCLLAKRWGSVWKLIPTLDYDDSLSAAPSGFIRKFLQLNNSPFLESFHLNLSRDYAPEDYETWVNVAIARNVRVKKVAIDNVPSTTCFRSLKSLSLLDVWFSSDETVTRLLSCCPILETLIVHRWARDKVKTFAICVPSLKSLTIRHIVGGYYEPRNDNGFVINAPSLKYLNIVDHLSRFYSLLNMPEQLKADIHIRHCDSEKLLGSLTSSKNLSLCLKPLKDAYLHSNFDQLVSLDLCAP